MPHSYQPNDSQRQRPQAVTRGQCGLPEDALVLGCFNQSFKIGPDNFAAWMRILQAVPNSLLWLLEDNEQATRNLRSEAQASGVDPARLVFAPRVATALHLSRLPLADLMLDNWPCNAHTTASAPSRPAIMATGSTQAACRTSASTTAAGAAAHSELGAARGCGAHVRGGGAAGGGSLP
jgi:predicted O-linked N-acetylglucosamine transferase (SPINDLY family)